MVLTWCRSSAAQRNGRVPVMRAYGETVCVIDASFIDWTADDATLASGADWVEVAAQLGVYGPQWEPAPTLAPQTARESYMRRTYFRRGGRR